MIAGHGIAHSEESPTVHSPILHGVQLWTARPDPVRHGGPHFKHHPDLPLLHGAGVPITMIVGERGGVASAAAVYSPLVGAEARLESGADARLPLRSDWEYAVLALARSDDVDGVTLSPGPCRTSAPAGPICRCAPHARPGCCSSAVSRSRSAS